MNAVQFSSALGKVNDKYIMEAITYERKKKSGWLKWGIMAACLLLIMGRVFMSPPTHNGSIIISKYSASSSGSYATPSPGTVAFTSEVRAAREKYDEKNVTFLLSFDIFKNNGEQIVGLSEEERIEEYQRLVSLGYELYTAECWTYQGKDQKRYYTTVVGYFTEGDLSLFRGNPEYGYMFRFVTNGDGSGISVDETDIIADFSTNYS